MITDEEVAEALRDFETLRTVDDTYFPSTRVMSEIMAGVLCNVLDRIEKLEAAAQGDKE